MGDKVTLGAGLSSNKGLDVLAREVNIREQAKRAHELFQSVYDELEDRDSDIRDGLSYLDLKNDTLLSYMIDVANIMLRKLNCKPIEGHQSVERTVEYRVILEKIKSIDQRLTYQLNKLITMPDDAVAEGGVNIKNLDVDVGSDSDGSDEEETSRPDTNRGNDNTGTSDIDGEEDDDDDMSVSSGDQDEEQEVTPVREKLSKKLQDKYSKKPVGLYKPPKLRSVAYVEKDRSSTNRSHDDFYRDDDEDEPTTLGGRSEVDKERTEFEEDHYTRLRDDNPKRAKRRIRNREYRRKDRKRRRR